VAAHGLPDRLRAAIPVAALAAAMARDKKARSGSLRFVLLKSIGEAVVVAGIPQKRVETAWREVGGT
jgi:3-dehydroquinate synthetase